MGDVRRARLDMMCAAKRQLQETAKKQPRGPSKADTRWMQGLRHVDTAHLEELHRGLRDRCMTVRMATSRSRELELHDIARQGIRDVLAIAESPEYEVRSRVARPV